MKRTIVCPDPAADPAATLREAFRDGEGVWAKNVERFSGRLSMPPLRH
jgi:hypothetical protein